MDSEPNTEEKMPKNELDNNDNIESFEVSENSLIEPESVSVEDVVFGDKIEGNKNLISVERYREVTGDYNIPDELIKKKMAYLSGFVINIIRLEINEYIKNKK